MHPRTMGTRRLSRRAFIGGLGVTALATKLGAPGLAGAQTPPATPLATAGPISIYSSGATLPTDTVTLKWLENGTGPRTVFMEDLFKVYHQAHPNITVDYTHFPVPKQQELLAVAVQSGKTPDVFQLSPQFTGAQVVQQGWVAPLDDIIPDFAAWKAGFPPNTFFSGVNVFGGKTYTFPITTNKWLTTALLFNTELMQAAGYDPAKQPLTWDEFRDAAKKITQAGKGKAFGFIIGGKQTDRWAQIVANLAEMAGAAGGEFNWKTGQFNYPSDEFLAAIDLLLGLKSDGSILPGSLQLSASDARERFPQGVAGMILQGQWNIPQWATQNPDFRFDIGLQPVVSRAGAKPMSYGPGGANQRWVGAESKVKSVAGDILHYLGTEAGQIAWGVSTQGSDPPLFARAQTASASKDERMQRVYQLCDQWLRLAPSPEVRNPDAASVALERRAVTPDFGTTVQGLFTGQINDAKKAMQDLANRSSAELDRAIKAAQAKGAKVSRDDWVFANWDPAKDYTEAAYKALP